MSLDESSSTARMIHRIESRLERRMLLVKEPSPESQVQSPAPSSPVESPTPSLPALPAPVRDTDSVTLLLDVQSLRKQVLRRRTNTGEFRLKFGKGHHPLVPSSTTIFDDPSIRSLRFYGFYVCFWFGVGLFAFDRLLHVLLEDGVGGITNTPLFHTLQDKVLWVGVLDLALYITHWAPFFVHLAARRGYIQMGRFWWRVQLAYQLVFVVGHNTLVHRLDYPWIGKIFLFLHLLVMLMKMHLYASYNGYLWSIHHELAFLRNLLKECEDESLRTTLEESVAFCQFELESQSTSTPFPSNITTHNFFMYTMYPTLVYQIEYLRTPRIRWGYFAEKVCAVFGTIFLMILVALWWMLPIIMQFAALRDTEWEVKLLHLPLLLLDLVPPFLLMYLLVWYLIWDAILNCIAELLCFGNRNFYNAWWNLTDWLMFARDWNVPVHEFLNQHVYRSAISVLNLNKFQLMVVTFLLLLVVHEFAMMVIFGKLRGYLFFLQMQQLPLVMISNTRWMKQRPMLGNAIFWLGIATGPSMMCALYLTF